MEKQHETTTRCIAVQRLRELQTTLLQQSQILVLNRAKVEKFRNTNLAKAQSHYQELEKSRQTLLSIRVWTIISSAAGRPFNKTERII